MHQLRLLDYIDANHVVNVASVPQRSPFRYPGGKTWLIPKIRLWLTNLAQTPSLFIEPFAGGGIVSLSVAFEELADQILMVELDEQVASVWQTILGGEADWLADQILKFNMTNESLTDELSKKGGTTREIAFRTLLRNRTSHGGILAPGAGLIKYGESGKGILSRWYPDTLAKRVRNIERFNKNISFIHGDGLDAIRKHKEDYNTVFFIDPPYTAAGKKAGTRLYFYHEIDHESLFTLLESIKGEFLMTYDNAEEIRRMAYRHGFKFTEVAMSNTHHATMNELLISKNLEWLR
ncbi:MAG: DNA adenine methylase [Dehalococcoidales bacterium]